MVSCLAFSTLRLTLIFFDLTSSYALIFYSPICLDPIEEKDIALTPCAHKFCSECIRSCLESLSSSREPRGNCPECRDLIKLSELTFLGDAKDCGEKKLTNNDEDQKPQAGEKSEEAIDVNGFASLVNLDNVHNLNAKIEREREEKNRKANKGKKPEPKKLDLTRADILQQAITNARPSASNRMRAAVMSIQEGEIEYLEW